MTVADLITRVYEHLDHRLNLVFWEQAEIVSNGLNPAQRLLVLFKPDLLVTRTPITVAVDEVFIDLRNLTPWLVNAVATKTHPFVLRRVTLGDTSSVPPADTGGRLGDLRQISLKAFRSMGRWFSKTAMFPSHIYRHGLFWLGFWPRTVQSVTATLVYNAAPSLLSHLTPNQVPDLPAPYHPVIAEVAAGLLLLKEGGGQEAERGLQLMQSVFGIEPFQGLLKNMRRDRYRAEMPQRVTA